VGTGVLREAFACGGEVTDLDLEVKKAPLVLLAEEISLLVRLAQAPGVSLWVIWVT